MDQIEKKRLENLQGLAAYIGARLANYERFITEQQDSIKELQEQRDALKEMLASIGEELMQSGGELPSAPVNIDKPKAKRTNQ